MLRSQRVKENCSRCEIEEISHDFQVEAPKVTTVETNQCSEIGGKELLVRKKIEAFSNVTHARFCIKCTLPQSVYIFKSSFWCFVKNFGWASYIFSCVFDCSYCTKIQLGNNPEFGKNTTFSPYLNGGLFFLSWFFPLKNFYFPIWIRSIFPTCSRSFLHYSRANEWVSNELNTFATNDRAHHTKH